MAGYASAPHPKTRGSASGDDREREPVASARRTLKVSARFYTSIGSVTSVASRSATAPGSTDKVDRQDFESS